VITIDDLLLIFQQVFDDDSIELTLQTSANDIEGWDSMSHVNLILAIENKFKNRFNQKELLLMQNVSDLLQAINNKL